MSTRSVSGW